MISMRGVGALAATDHVVPLAGRCGSARMSGFAGEEVGEEAHVVGVVGDDEEIERPRQLRRLARRGHDLFAFGEAIGIARPEPGAERARVERERRCAGACRRRTAASGNCAPRRASRRAWSGRAFRRPP